MEEKVNQVLATVVEISAGQDQIHAVLERMDSRLAKMEIKMGQVEKWLSLENADFRIRK